MRDFETVCSRKRGQVLEEEAAESSDEETPIQFQVAETFNRKNEKLGLQLSSLEIISN